MLDQYGEGIVPDLRFYYGIDVLETIAGRGLSPSLILMHIHRLPDTSMTHALASGGTEFFGWGQDRHLMADLYDALSYNTVVSGSWKGKPPTPPTWPRPVKTEKKPVTLQEVWARLSS